MNNAQLIGEYQRDQRRRGMRPSSIARIRVVLEALGRFNAGLIIEVTRLDVEEWLDDRPLSPKTIYNYLSTVATFLEWAREAGLVERNVARTIPRPKLRRGLPRPIDATDLAMAVQLAPPRERSWLLLAALAGLRCCEIAGIARDDIQDQELPALLVVTHAKGGYQRIVPLHDEALLALRSYGLPKTGPVFRSSITGHQLRPERVSQAGNLYLRRLGVEATMHQLRHRFATDFFRASRDLRLTQEVLGHQSPSTTAIYTAWSPAEAAAIIAGLSIQTVSLAATVPADGHEDVPVLR